MSARIEPLTAEKLDDEAQAAFAGRVPASGRPVPDLGAPDGPPLPTVLGLLLNHPKLAGPWFAYNNVLLFDPRSTPASAS